MKKIIFVLFLVLFSVYLFAQQVDQVIIVLWENQMVIGDTLKTHWIRVADDEYFSFFVVWYNL